MEEKTEEKMEEKQDSFDKSYKEYIAFMADTKLGREGLVVVPEHIFNIEIQIFESGISEEQINSDIEDEINRRKSEKATRRIQEADQYLDLKREYIRALANVRFGSGRAGVSDDDRMKDLQKIKKELYQYEERPRSDGYEWERFEECLLENEQSVLEYFDGYMQKIVECRLEILRIERRMEKIAAENDPNLTSGMTMRLIVKHAIYNGAVTLESYMEGMGICAREEDKESNLEKGE